MVASSAIVREVLAVRVVNVPAAAELPPTIAPSTVPAFISTLLDVTGETAKVTQASLASFLIFRTLLLVSNQTNPAVIATAGAEDEQPL